MPLTAGSALSEPSRAASSSWPVSAGQLVVERLDPHLRAGLALHAHVDLGRGVVAHEHRRQAGLDARGAQLGHLRGHALAHAGRHRACRR